MQLKNIELDNSEPLDEIRFRARLLDGSVFHLAVNSENNPGNVHCFKFAGQKSAKEPLYFILRLWPLEHDRSAGISRRAEFQPLANSVWDW